MRPRGDFQLKVAGGQNVKKGAKFFKNNTLGCANSQKNYIAGCTNLQKNILLGTLFLYTRVYIQKLY